MIKRGLASVCVVASALAGVVGLSVPAYAASYAISDDASCSAFLSTAGVSGAAQGSCLLLPGATIASGDTVTLAAGSYALRPQGNVNDAPVTNNGTVVTLAGGPGPNLYVAAPTTNNGSMSLGGIDQIYGTLTNNGTVTVSGRLLVGGSTSFLNAGRLVVTCDGRLAGSAVSGTAPQFDCGPTAVALSASTIPVTSPGGTTVGTLSTPTSTTPLPATYTYTVVSTEGDFTVSGNQLRTTRALSAGDHPVTVRSTDQNGSYLDQQFTVTVTRSSQVVEITTTPFSPTVGGTYVVSASGGPSSQPVTFSTSTAACVVNSGTGTGTVSFVHAGPCAITATQAGDANYAGGSDTQTFDVSRAAQTVRFTSTAPSGTAAQAGATYTAAASTTAPGHTPTITSATTSVCTVSGTTVQLVTAGTCTLTADQAEDQDYLAAAPVTQSFPVTLAPQTLTITSAPGSPSVGGTYTPTVTRGGSSKNVVVSSSTPQVCTVPDGRTVSFDHAGLCRVMASQGGDGTYQSGTTSQDVTVARAPQGLAFSTLAPTGPVAQVGDTYRPVVSSDQRLPVALASTTPSVCRLSGQVVLLVGAGTCTVTADQGGDGDHLPAGQVAQSFTVNPAGVATIRATASSRSGINAAGWSRSPVTVTFTCAPSPGATLAGDCSPATVSEKQVRDRVVVRTVTDSFGSAATASVTVRIDRVAPKVHAGGVRNRATYRAVRPVRCLGTDRFSGIDTCTVASQRKVLSNGRLEVSYVLTATDVAGNTTTRRGHYYVRGSRQVS